MGEALQDFQRDLFARVFQCECYSYYGAFETSAIACECPEHSGYHVAAENVIVEVVDVEGRPVAPGQEGRVLTTNLHNYGMPMIRYEIGDLAVTSDRQCPCGRGLPLLAAVNGRTADVLHTTDGRQGPGVSLPLNVRGSLDEVVISCVNRVGVDLNTASMHLLAYVSGLGPQLAQNIVEYRAQNGAFTSRSQLGKVRRLGAKAFEQAAGFLRIRDAESPLDASAVHPESYGIVGRMANDAGCTVSELMREERLRRKIEINRYVSGSVGLPTLRDILKELAAPGRDPRKRFEAFSFKTGIISIQDLEEGMRLPGIVTNVTAFGAFVDVGVHQDGLVHISNLADRFVKNPGDIVKVGQQVSVTVMAVDVERRRISLSMKNTN